MPSRNISRQDSPDSYYHVYSRGASKAAVFVDTKDKDYFLYLISRHLSLEPKRSRTGYLYPHYRNKIELLAYCLMGNHIHLLVYQLEQGATTHLMKSVISAYVAYFNRRHKRTGSLFENRFKAAMITNEPHLSHISRYIHLNPRSWKLYAHSSYKHTISNTEPEWLQTGRILANYNNRSQYGQFVADYEENKQTLDAIKHELADL